MALSFPAEGLREDGLGELSAQTISECSPRVRLLQIPEGRSGGCGSSLIRPQGLYYVTSALQGLDQHIPGPGRC